MRFEISAVAVNSFLKITNLFCSLPNFSYYRVSQTVAILVEKWYAGNWILNLNGREKQLKETLLPFNKRLPLNWIAAAGTGLVNTPL